MKIWLMLLLVAILSTTPLLAQDDGSTRALNLSLFYPLSTNGSREVCTGTNISLIYGNVGSVRAFDLSGAVSVINHDFRGFQLAGLVAKVKGDASGVRIAGLYNYTGGRLSGWQMGGLNRAANLSGTQVGLINTADSVQTGVQIGLINIARKQHGVPIGLVNLADNGKLQAVVYGTSYANINAGLRFLANQFYSELAIGRTSLEFWTEQSTIFSFHYGYMMPLTEEYQMSADVGYLHVYNNPELTERDPEEDVFALQLRFLLHIQITEQVAAFGGGGTTFTFKNYSIPGYDYFHVLFLAGLSFF
jgi:hypothetical protein